jgi:hypothetical protein
VNDSFTGAPIHPVPSICHWTGIPEGSSSTRSFIFGPRPLSSTRQSICTEFPEPTTSSFPMRSPFETSA